MNFVLSALLQHFCQGDAFYETEGQFNKNCFAETNKKV